MALRLTKTKIRELVKAATQYGYSADGKVQCPVCRRTLTAVCVIPSKTEQRIKQLLAHHLTWDGCDEGVAQ